MRGREGRSKGRDETKGKRERWMENERKEVTETTGGEEEGQPETHSPP